MIAKNGTDTSAGIGGGLDPALNRAPDQVRSLYLMGIGGVAMGALAGALARRGLQVRGSDRPLYPPMSTFLAERRIEVLVDYQAANLMPAPDLVIVGNVIRRDNPEAVELARLGLPYLSLPQALAHFFLAGKSPIVVCGTHGKTTTTALIASALRRSGSEAGFMLGGIMNEGGLNFAEGAARHFVVEGDEYDTAFFAKRPKFVYYQPRIALLTSLEFDHADIYPNLDAVRAAFGQLMAVLPTDGALIAWGDSDEVLRAAEAAPCPVVTYGQGQDCAWRLLAAHPAEGGGSELIVRGPDGAELTVRTPLVGRHNALNVTGAMAALAVAGESPDRAAELQAGFGGVKRRQEVRGQAGGVVVVDDFAHHPTAVRETVDAVARFGLPGWPAGSGRVVACFEPRSNTSRRGFFQNDYPRSFDGAEVVMLREPAMVEEIPAAERFSAARLAEDLRTRGINARSFDDTDALLAGLLEELRPGDLCLIMSNGGFDNLHERLLTALQDRP